MARTVPFEARLDICSLATIDRYYRDSGVTPRSRSELIFMAVQDLCHLLTKSNKVELITSINDAATYLEETYGGMGKPGRNSRTLLSERRAETLIEDGLDPTYLRIATKAPVSDEEMRAAIAKAAADLGIKPTVE